MNKKLFPYFKQTRRKHDSGYRMFEVGYIEEDQKTKHVIGSYVDHIMLGGYTDKEYLMVNLDIMDNGCVRVFTHREENLRWRTEKYCLSSMEIKLGEPTLFKQKNK